MNTSPLRLATPADALTVATLLHDFNREYDDPTPEPPILAERIRQLLADGDTVICLTGEPVVGLALLRLRRSLWSEGRECYLAELYVRPDRRGQGLGRALMEYVFETARAAGAVYMDLNTGADDTGARHLYESLGFSSSEGVPGGPVNYYYERDL